MIGYRCGVYNTYTFATLLQLICRNNYSTYTIDAQELIAVGHCM